MCEKWGVKHRHVDDVGRRRDQDIVVDCTGDARGLELAMELVRPRGKLVLKSLTPGAPAPDLTPIVVNEIEVIGSYAGPVREAVAVLARGEIDVVSLISKRMTLEDGAALFPATEQAGALKVLVGL